MFGCAIIFAWEYKDRHKDLHKAYCQLNEYREQPGKSSSGTFMRQGSGDGVIDLVFPMNAEGVASNQVLPGRYHSEFVVHLKITNAFAPRLTY